ncbi:MAG TPA: hypothetical protein VF666_14325 [Pyrinomonadaceae bacterium]|jgi:hypothetical protein
MRKLFITCLVVALSAIGALGQSQSAPTLRIQTEAPSLPSELFYGNTRVKPLRLRPGTNVPITIFDADFFVQQQYVDFLSRFPDQSGFNFWFNQIAGCGTNAGCIEEKRINTSAAFFLSIEFKETGFLVHRLQRVSFGTLPRYAEFMPQVRQIGNGVIVNVGNWQQQLESNTQAFLNAWVSRSDFQAAYPASMTPAAYVDKLIATAGVAPADVNRDALVAGLTNGSETRATVLRKIAESQAVSNKETNSAFVLMQYFGYLRRNPNDAPDTDMRGYDFWLKKLNEFGGDFKRAEMVKAFLVSGEYKDRF